MLFCTGSFDLGIEKFYSGVFWVYPRYNCTFSCEVKFYRFDPNWKKNKRVLLSQPPPRRKPLKAYNIKV